MNRYRRLPLQVDVLTTAKVQKPEGDTYAAALGSYTGTARWINSQWDDSHGLHDPIVGS